MEYSVYSRILVATRDIKPGETIFSERPLVAGPAKASDTDGQDITVCIQCLNKVSKKFKSSFPKFQ